MKMVFLSIAYFLSLPAQASPSSLPTAEQLLDGWKNAIYTEWETSDMTLTLTDKEGKSLRRELQLFYKGKANEDSKILLRFKSPATIRGMAFLSLKSPEQRRADQWLYIPAYKKARRISASHRDESFLDSDFSNGDISFEYENAFDFKVIGEKTIGDAGFYVVEGRVKPERKSEVPYSREVLYFSKKDRLAARVEFYDKKNNLAKLITASKWKKMGSRWVADRIEVSTVATRHRSVLEFVRRGTSAPPPDRIFSLSHLESGRDR